MENQVCSETLTECTVFLEISGVAGQILGWSELHGIDKNADNYLIIIFRAFVIRLPCPSWR